MILGIIRSRGRSSLLLVSTSVWLLAAACSDEAVEARRPASPDSAATASATVERQGAFQIVTTSNIVADWVRQVGGERMEVFSLVPVGGDPHSFQPGAQDVARIAEADLVVSIGLKLEATWLDELIRNAAADESRLVALGQAVEPLRFVEANDQDGDGPLDAHFWFDPLRVKRAVSHIAARLSVMDPDGGDTYVGNARAYGQRLDDLHAWIQQRVSTLAQDRRLLVTSHDTFQYFAKLYGFEVVGAVIPGSTTEREPSASELAILVESIRERKAPAIFVENTVSDRLARTMARETGARVVNALYTGSLSGPDGDAATYIEMLRTNVRRIVEALR